MEFHATVLEVLACAGVGGYIGFLIGLRYGIYIANRKKRKRVKKA